MCASSNTSFYLNLYALYALLSHATPSADTSCEAKGLIKGADGCRRLAIKCDEIKVTDDTLNMEVSLPYFFAKELIPGTCTRRAVHVLPNTWANTGVAFIVLLFGAVSLGTELESVLVDAQGRLYQALVHFHRAPISMRWLHFEYIMQVPWSTLDARPSLELSRTQWLDQSHA